MSCIWTQLTPFNLLALVYRCYTRGCVVKELSDPSISASRSSFISKAYYTQEKYDLTWRNLVAATKLSYHSNRIEWINAFLGYVFLNEMWGHLYSRTHPQLPPAYFSYLPYIQVVLVKLCFLTPHCNFFPCLHITLSDRQSSQCSVSVQSLLLAGLFLYNQ